MIAVVAVIRVFTYKQGKSHFRFAMTILTVCMPFHTKESLTADSTAMTANHFRESLTVTEWEIPRVMT